MKIWRWVKQKLGITSNKAVVHDYSNAEHIVIKSGDLGKQLKEAGDGSYVFVTCGPYVAYENSPIVVSGNGQSVYFDTIKVIPYTKNAVAVNGNDNKVFGFLDIAETMQCKVRLCCDGSDNDVALHIITGSLINEK